MEPLIITEEQADSLERIIARFETLPDSLAGELFFDSCLLVVISGMTIGIEEDGYAHS